jgi:GWxTD domain-containing protein
MVCFLVLPLLLALQAPPFPLAGPGEEPTPEWRAGPVRYILKVKEDERYKRLKTREERQEFIRKFWEALDPTPGTPANERRQVFWDRVDRANRLFHDSTKPGWLSDRGKIYILLGPPHDLSRRQNGDIWTYRALPNRGAPPELRMLFYRDRSGEYRMSPRALTYQPLIRTPIGPLGDDELSLMADLGCAQIVKDRIWIPELDAGRIEEEYFFGAIQSVRRFTSRWAADGATFVTLAAAVPAGQFQRPGESLRIPELVASVTLVEEGSGKAALRIRERMVRDRSWDPASGRALQFEIGFGVPPGSYRAEYSLVDPASHLGSYYTESLTVPDFRTAFSMSDVTLAHVVEKDTEPDPDHLGRPVPVPDPTASFFPGETLHLSYEVYHAERSGEDAALEVEYDFFYRADTGMWPVGNPVLLHGVTRESLGYILPLASWPAGQYRLRVKVTDTPTGAAAEREADFTILPYSSGAAPSPATPER